MSNILLVEPDFKNKFPPLGLLKIASYHRSIGDNVFFVKGCSSKENIYWDRIYISTLFSFYHKKTIETILFYKRILKGNIKKIMVGGIYATLFPDKIYKETGIYPYKGLLDKPGILGDNKIIVDELIPDYDVIKNTDHEYSLIDSYFGYGTRGCPNKCGFCAVHRIEPQYVDYIDLKKYVNNIERNFGPKRDLVLFDNNVLASTRFKDIINDILELGFEKGSKFNGRQRSVDFNQGVDARRINKENARLLSKICIKPLRIAFDDIKFKNIYINAVEKVVEEGITNLSNYILFNYLDYPEDLYERLRINVVLNEDLGAKIYSFPMRYTPLDAIDRTFIGQNWNKKQIRGIQCIINVTNGIVGTRIDFFKKAFGNTLEDFKKLILMPDLYILKRLKYENSEAKDWLKIFNSLGKVQKSEFLDYISDIDHEKIEKNYSLTGSMRMKNILAHYIESDKYMKENKGELWK